MAHYGVAQYITYKAVNSSTGALLAGDVANHTLTWLKDATATAATNTPTEVSAGTYKLQITAAEAQCLTGQIVGTSSTSNIVLIGPLVAFEKLPNAIPDATGGLPIVDASGRTAADVEAVSGDTDAANNLELMYDGTGYTDETAPASRSQVGALTSGSGGVSITAESFTKAGAEPETNTYTTTFADDGIFHIVEDDATSTDVYYQFDITGNGSPQSVEWNGYAQSNGDSYAVYAYNWGGAAWQQVGSINGLNGTTEREEQWILTVAHVGTGANAGKVRLRFLSSDGTAIATDRILCTYAVISQTAGYALGAIWVNTNASNTNTENYVDGTADNPVSTWAAALTLSGQLGIDHFHISGGSSITLTGDSTGYELVGEGAWDLALGTQTVTNAYIHRASVSGTGNGTGTIFEDCDLENSVSIPAGQYLRCGLCAVSGTPITASTAGEYLFVNPHSGVAGSGTPYLSFSGKGSATGVNIRGLTGGSNILLDSDNTLSLEVLAGGGQTVTTGGADVEIRGICRAVTVAMSAAETVQIACVTGPITLSGTTTGTVNLYGVSTSVTDTTSGATTTDGTVQNFDPATDAVANVTLVGTTTTNTDFSTMFAGISSLADWLRGLFRKDAMDTTAKIEINTGGGTFNETTDALQALADTMAPVALDGGDPTLGGMLTKMADDNDGADFDATQDSLAVIAQKVNTLEELLVQSSGAVASNNTATNQINLAAADAALVDPFGIRMTTGDAEGEVFLCLENDSGTAYLKRDKKGTVSSGNEYTIFATEGGEHRNEGYVRLHEVVGGKSVITLNPLASSVNDAMNGQVIFFPAGLNANDQSGRIDSYDGTSKKATLNCLLASAPALGTSYVIYPQAALPNGYIEDKVWDAVRASHVAAGSMGEVQFSLDELKAATVTFADGQTKSLEECFKAAWAAGYGPWKLTAIAPPVGEWEVFGPAGISGGTADETFDVDSTTAPTERDPQ